MNSRRHAARMPLPQSLGRSTAVLLIGALAFLHSFQAMAAGDAVHGEAVYQACTSCHSLDDNDIGPKHRNVVGRKAGSVPDYRYSDALRNSGITWNEEALDKWLTDPQTLVAGSKMYFRLPQAQDRADVIAYLKAKATVR